jgi:hypothetical protein
VQYAIKLLKQYLDALSADCGFPVGVGGKRMSFLIFFHGQFLPKKTKAKQHAMTLLGQHLGAPSVCGGLRWLRVCVCVCA